MASMAEITTKWNAFAQKVRPGMEKTGRVIKKIHHVTATVCKWVYNLRGVFLAIPVVIVALRIAHFNAENLPEQVGLNLLSNGEFAQMIERTTAVNAPVCLTFACLALMLFTRRPLYPWLISIFTLVLPLLILATNNFNALMGLLNLVTSKFHVLSFLFA